MSATIVYAFAVEAGLMEPEGAPPLDVLSRQAARLLVSTLNGDGDRGFRFFPLMGFEGERRRFFTIGDLLPETAAAQLHRQQDVCHTVHGRFEEGAVRLRVLDRAGATCFQELIPFDPAAPLAGVARLAFEVGGVFGLHPSGFRRLHLSPPATTPFLAARDGLLALDANLLLGDPQRLITDAVEVLEWEPKHPDVREMVLQIGSRLLERNLVPQAVAALLIRAARIVRGDATFADVAARLLEGAGLGVAAADVHRAAAEADPMKTHSVWRAAAAAFDGGRLKEAQALLHRAVSAGNRATVLLAQLAVVAKASGEADLHNSLMEEVVAAPSLAPSVARIAAVHLVDQQRLAEAVELLTERTAAHPDHAGLMFELGRALLGIGDGEGARATLERVLQLRPEATLEKDARRLLRFAAEPAALESVQRIDRHLQDGSLALALAEVKHLLRRCPELGEAWLLLGTIRHRLDHPRRAIRALRRSIALDPELGEAHNRLGILLVCRGDVAAGCEHLRRAVRLMPDHPSPHIHLAQACSFLGRPEDALAALAEAERLGGPMDTIAAVRRALHRHGP